MNILVIDDTESFRFLLEKILEEHKVVSASNGEEGLKIFFQSNFDLVITDHQMPGMLGEELIRKIKSSNPLVKTVLMSSILSPMLKQVAKAAGADYFIDKMFLFSEVNSAIKNLFPALLPR